MKDRTRLKPEDFKKISGSIEAHQYRFDEKSNVWIKYVRKIRGVAAARLKADKFYLATNAGTTGRMYLTKEGKLSYDRKDARPFYKGYDVPENRIKHWSAVTQIKLYDVC